WAAFAAAMLFAVHPVQAEAVCWAAALSTLLFSTFYLLSALVYLRWTDKGAGWLVLSVGIFLLSSLAKSAAVTLPLVLLTIDYYRFGKPERRHWLAKLPYLAISLFFGFKTFLTRSQEGHDIQAASSGFSILDRFWMIGQTILFYPVKLLVPIGYSLDYPFLKSAGVWPWTYYAAPLALLVLGFLIWKNLRHQREVLLGLALYLLPLSIMLPHSTVGSFELRSDRYVYLSCAGLFFVAAIALQKLPTAQLRNSVLAVLTLGLSLLAYRQSTVWHNGVDLFENCVAQTPKSPLCNCNLGYNDLLHSDYQGAIQHYSTALQFDPNTVEAYNGRGQAYFGLRKIPEALADFDKAIQAGIVTPKLFLNRGKCLVILSRPAEALPALNRSLELEARAPEAYYFRAVAYEKTGAPDKAIVDYSQVIQLNQDPAIQPKLNYVESYVNRGMLQYNAQHYPEAIADNTSALNIAAAAVQSMILCNRANAYLLSGQLQPALADANRALQINPNDARSYQTRAAVYQALGQPVAAQADLQKMQALQARTGG
ncbi:MAG: tetratricopeptide repeat protein, partial [Saprospiraceae bacterium]